MPEGVQIRRRRICLMRSEHIVVNSLTGHIFWLGLFELFFR